MCCTIYQSFLQGVLVEWRRNTYNFIIMSKYVKEVIKENKLSHKTYVIAFQVSFLFYSALFLLEYNNLLYYTYSIYLYFLYFSFCNIIPNRDKCFFDYVFTMQNRWYSFICLLRWILNRRHFLWMSIVCIKAQNIQDFN